MSQIEDLLRDALVTSPTPPMSTLDPLSELNRRIGRARLRRSAFAVVGVVAVVAAIAIPLSLPSTSPAPRPTSPATHSVVTKLPHSFGGAVTAGGGYVWSLRQDFHHIDHVTGSQNAIVVQREPGSLRPLHRYRVPGPADFVAYGLNRVWVRGGGDGGYPNARLSVINLSDNHVTTIPFVRGRPIGDITFESGTAWVLGELPTQLVRVDVHGDQVSFGHAQAVPPAATQLVAGDNGDVYAVGPPHPPNGAQDTVAVIDASTGRRVAAPRPDGHLLLVLPQGFLAVRNGQLVTEDATGAVVGQLLPRPVGIVEAIEDPTRHAVFVVSVRGNCRYHQCVLLKEYSLASLEQATPTVIASAQGHRQAEFSIAADPSGSLLLTDGELAFRWTPTP